MSPNVLALLPEFILTLTGVLIMLAEPCLKPASSRKPLGWIAIVGTVAALVASWYQLSFGATIHAFSNTIQVDAFSVFFHYSSQPSSWSPCSARSTTSKATPATPASTSPCSASAPSA